MGGVRGKSGVKACKRPLLSAATCAAAGALIFLPFCRNPFFPHIGKPDDASLLRSTPSGVIKQLVNSYEQRRPDLFEALLPATFRFYVSPTFVTTYQSSGKYYVNPAETRDTLLQHIGAFPYYYYWTHDVEVESHRKLFSQALSIRFTLPFNVNPGNFRYIINGNNDTTNVEVLMMDGKIALELDMGGGDIEVDSIWIDKQVFFLERDADNLWVIRKWYDFGSQP
jgi:hypothetical protein